MDRFSCERNIVSASQPVVIYLQFPRFFLGRPIRRYLGQTRSDVLKNSAYPVLYAANGSNKIYRSSVVVKANSLRSWGSQSMRWRVFTGAMLYWWQMGDWGLVTKLRGKGRGWGSGQTEPLPPPPLYTCYFHCDFVYKTRLTLPCTNAFFAEDRVDWKEVIPYATQVNSAFRAIWLVPLSPDIKCYSPPGGFWRKKWRANPISPENKITIWESCY